jgi:hypothetical protein
VKNKYLLFILIIINNICVGQDPKSIEKKVCELYNTYSKKKYIKANVRGELDSLSLCQLKYLSSLDSVMQLSHTNNFDGLQTFDKRVQHYYINVSQSHFAEDLSGFYKGDGNYGSEDKIANKLFDTLLGSPPHKKILDKRINKSYSFKVTRSKDGAWILIGVFSGDEIFFFREFN